MKSQRSPDRRHVLDRRCPAGAVRLLRLHLQQGRDRQHRPARGAGLLAPYGITVHAIAPGPVKGTRIGGRDADATADAEAGWGEDHPDWAVYGQASSRESPCCSGSTSSSPGRMLSTAARRSPDRGYRADGRDRTRAGGPRGPGDGRSCTSTSSSRAPRASRTSTTTARRGGTRRMRPAAISDLEVRDLGVKTIDPTGFGLNRNIHRLQRVNAEVDINIVCTGLYVFIEVPGYLKYRPAEVPRGHLRAEIEVGIDDTGVKAAFPQVRRRELRDRRRRPAHPRRDRADVDRHWRAGHGAHQRRGEDGRSP